MRYLLSYGPEYTRLGRLGSAGAQELNTVEPDSSDTVVLVAGAGDGEVENGTGPGGGRREVR
jgi:hypothetical protein